MLLYDTKVAPNPRRVRIFLAEKRISVPTREIDLGKMEHKNPDYAEVNELQRTPTLVLDDGTRIAESVAICRYFEETQPEPPLFGRGAVGRALTEMWQRRMELSFLLPVAMAFRHSHPAMAAMEIPQIPQVAETSRPRVMEFLKLLDARLAETRFIAGDEYSIADITGLVAMDFMRPAKIKAPEDLKNLARWYAEVSARPSAAA